MLKTCTTCGVSKESTVEYFPPSKRSQDGLLGQCRECHNARWREYYQRNREKVITRTSEYQKRNPAVRRLAKANWKIAHREADLAETKDRSRRWRENNRDKDRAASKRWRQNNNSAYRVIQQRARSLRMNCEGSFSEEQWEQIKTQFQHTCPMCGKSEPEIKLSIDHIVPLSQGGSNNIDNIQPLCKRCNAAKGARVIIDYRCAAISVVSKLSE